MTTWYDPDEIKFQADNAKIQPEFSPLHDTDDPLNEDEGIRIVDDLPEEDETLSGNVDDFEARVNEINSIVEGL